MAIISPDEITAKAVRAWPRFLKQWVQGNGDLFFPYRVRARLAVNNSDPKSTIDSFQTLVAKSKEHRGWGYTVHREQIRLRDLGSNLVPRSVTIDTLEDLLRLAKMENEFSVTDLVAKRIRQEFPVMESWVVANVVSLSKLAPSIDGLVQVARFFVQNPMPDCYIRQIPVPVDTKFVERHRATLRQWLDILLPPSAIDVNETTFARRFGLRDGQPHRAIRLLDPMLQDELHLPFDEFSLPIRLIAALPVSGVTVFVVENSLNLLTLPDFPRGIAIRGEGNAVNRLERISWLASCPIYYWGDIDVEGFTILSRLRNLFPNTTSLMMDLETLQSNREFVVDGNGTAPSVPSNLTPGEVDAFKQCISQNSRLEQEKIPQTWVDQAIAKVG